MTTFPAFTQAVGDWLALICPRAKFAKVGVVVSTADRGMAVLPVRPSASPGTDLAAARGRALAAIRTLIAEIYPQAESFLISVDEPDLPTFAVLADADGPAIEQRLDRLTLSEWAVNPDGTLGKRRILRSPSPRVGVRLDYQGGGVLEN